MSKTVTQNVHCGKFSYEMIDLEIKLEQEPTQCLKAHGVLLAAIEKSNKQGSAERAPTQPMNSGARRSMGKRSGTNVFSIRCMVAGASRTWESRTATCSGCGRNT
jgi:hypothetical protein